MGLHDSSPSDQTGNGRRSKIEYLPIGSVLPDPKNPRVHSRQQVRAIARSIEAFGFNAPILVSGKNRIVAGHARLEAAKLQDMLEVPVIRLEHLSEAQAKAYMLADNKLTDRSIWDDEKLAYRLKELREIALDFDIEATGFEAPEIDLKIQSLEPADAADIADEFKPPEGPIISRPGDLWILGSHRLLCGNALDPAAYATLLDTEKTGCVFMDPPYNVKISGHAVGNPSGAKPPLPVIQVGNLETSLERILAAGAVLIVPIFSFPGGRRFHVRDPGGSEIAVTQPDGKHQPQRTIRHLCAAATR
jgi:ParB-like nuclease domain